MLAVERVKTSNLSGVKAGVELVEIALADGAASGTAAQTVDVPLGKTYRSVKPVAAVGQGDTTFGIGVVPSLGSVSVKSITAASVSNTKVFVTLECEV